MEGKGGEGAAGRSPRRAFTQIAAENERLIRSGAFAPDWLGKRGQSRMLRQCKEVDILRLPDLQNLREGFWERHKPEDPGARPVCQVSNEDCCTAARRLADRNKPLVMNFANPYSPGGGYLNGAAAQEESICRRTTLYASLSHPEAYEVYRFNRMLHRPTDSGCMIWSPHVYIFRDGRLHVSEDVVEISVLSVPAPNLNGPAAHVEPAEIDRVMYRRLQNFLMKAVEEDCRSLVLGAWGCGVFGHDAGRVAGYFRRALFEEGFGAFFGEIVFAVLDHSVGQRNFRAFCREFADLAQIVE